ncbi:DUF4058 family protein [Romeria aff. gracilis LEGE 07310]|uniref:DUF4058 family protein n=2 Tax=Vasconcelosia TaxID=3366328 RepID=A0A8J7DB76_9CYAN|nr:DUF4058 family protein [Romeria aff. gracilis LEGE 07310]
MPVLDAAAAGDYHILISNSERSLKSDWYTVNLQEPLHTLPIPLLGHNESTTPSLKALFDTIRAWGYSASFSSRDNLVLIGFLPILNLPLLLS